MTRHGSDGVGSVVEDEVEAVRICSEDRELESLAGSSDESNQNSGYESLESNRPSSYESNESIAREEKLLGNCCFY